MAKKATVLFAAAKADGRAVNVYHEHTSEGDFLWYTTEDGREVGRKRLEEINERTEVRNLVGYEFDIEYSKENVDRLMKAKSDSGQPMIFGKTKFYLKDGHTRNPVKKEEF